MRTPSPDKPPAPVDPVDRFVRRLAAAHNAGDRTRLGALRRWTPGTVNADVIRMTADAPDSDVTAYALTGALFATWHQSRSRVVYGHPDSNLGRALRQLGRRPATGPSDPGADRVLRSLLNAQDSAALATALHTAGRRLTGEATNPPNWQLLTRDLVAWHQPTRRDVIRQAWARGFYRYEPTAATATA